MKETTATKTHSEDKSNKSVRKILVNNIRPKHSQTVAGQL